MVNCPVLVSSGLCVKNEFNLNEYARGVFELIETDEDLKASRCFVINSYCN